MDASSNPFANEDGDPAPEALPLGYFALGSAPGSLVVAADAPARGRAPSWQPGTTRGRSASSAGTDGALALPSAGGDRPALPHRRRASTQLLPGSSGGDTTPEVSPRGPGLGSALVGLDSSGEDDPASVRASSSGKDKGKKAARAARKAAAAATAAGTAATAVAASDELGETTARGLAGKVDLVGWQLTSLSTALAGDTSKAGAFRAVASSRLETLDDRTRTMAHQLTELVSALRAAGVVGGDADEAAVQLIPGRGGHGLVLGNARQAARRGGRSACCALL